MLASLGRILVGKDHWVVNSEFGLLRKFLTYQGKCLLSLMSVESFQYTSVFKEPFPPLHNAFYIGWVYFVHCSKHSLHYNYRFVFGKPQNILCLHHCSPCFPLSAHNNNRCVKASTEKKKCRQTFNFRLPYYCNSTILRQK